MKTYRALFVLFFSILLAALAVSACATPLGTAFTYQGKLTDSSGNPLSGSYNMTFELFNAATSGSQIGSTVTSSGVAVSNGLFAVQIDFGTGAFTGSATWLQTTVNGQVISPLVQITNAPNAIYAQSAGSVSQGSLSNYAGDIQDLASTSVNPSVVGSAGTGSGPSSVAISGRYAYVANFCGSTLQVIDVSNPASPSIVGSVGTGAKSPISVAVSGRYAYVANEGSDTLQVIDVSNPAGPSVVGSVVTGGSPFSVAVTGRYA